MNKDNQRLLEIQQLKNAYGNELEKATTISDCLIFHSHIVELEKEEKEILKRFDVII